MSTQPDPSYAERLTRIETILEHSEKQSQLNGEAIQKVLELVLGKIDMLDAKIEARFQSVETSAHEDAKELQALKNKGAGVLAAIGVIFTVTATIFADFFFQLKQALFG